MALEEGKQLLKAFDVTLVSNEISSALPGGIRTLNVVSPRFDYLRRFSHATNEVSAALTVRRKVEHHHKTSPFTLLICHGHVLARLAGLVMTRRVGLPYILVSHGDIYDRPEGTYDWLTTNLYKAVTRTAYRYASMIITLSSYMKDCALRHGADAELTKVIPNGIDPASIGLYEVDSEGRGTGEVGSRGGLTVLYVGRLSREKGPEILIEAMAVLKNRGIVISLIVCGEGPMSKQLQDKVRSYDLGSCVRFRGNVERKQLSRIYKSADVLCVPSISDAFPGVVLESLICGTPVIASRSGGMVDVVRSGTNGMLVAAPTAPGFAEALEKLVQNPSYLRKLSSNSINSVWPKYSWDKVGAELRERITELIERTHSLR